MDGLLLEELVSREGVEGEEATDVPDVGLKDGDVASLEEDRRERRIGYLTAKKMTALRKKRKVSFPFMLQLTREYQFFWLTRMRGAEKW